MPHIEVPKSQERAAPEDLAHSENDAEAHLARGADGNIPRFDQIVTPHPVVAFLFRRRTFIVLLAILAMVPLSAPKPLMFAAGFALAVLAEAWRIWAAGTIHKTEELTTGGPYAFVRHPLYVGSFLHAVAYCLMSGHWTSFAVVLPLFFLLYGAAVSTEEAMLCKIFGERYVDYSRRVPRFIPRLSVPQRGEGSFSWRQAMANKEYVNVIWMLLLCGLFIWRLK
ncbi:MAG: phospholipid methyltransferase [Armatimonadetes bacterium]|nr:phospholipid methyltransferase [Armatimonadota bacterium]